MQRLFLRPATSGGVESLPNTPPPPFPSSSTTLPDSPSQLPPTVTFDDLLKQEADKGLRQVQQAFSTTLESKAIAMDTAASLENQTKQLESIQEDLEDIHDTLDVVDHNVDKLTTGVIKVPGRRNHTTRRSNDNRFREKMNKVKTWPKENGILFSKKKGNQKQQLTTEQPTVTKQKSYSEYDNEGVRKTLQKQDGFLDQTSNALRELKELAVGMGEQLDKESKVLEKIDAPYVSHRIRYNTSRIRKSILT